MAEVVINEQQYRILLEMINMSTFVTHYHARPGRDDWQRAFESVSDVFLSQAKKMGCGDLVEKDKESGTWLPCQDYEEESFFRECLDDMIEQTFWEELVGRLTDKDIWRTIGEEKWAKLDDDERQRVRENRDAHYWKEFEARGVEHLELISRSPSQ